MSYWCDYVLLTISDWEGARNKSFDHAPGDRDRLVVLKKAQKKLITQLQAAEEMKLSERQVRLSRRLKKSGGRAVIHGLRGRQSNRRLDEQRREMAVRIPSQEVYRGCLSACRANCTSRATDWPWAIIAARS